MIHVNDDLHATVKGYCKARGVQMSDWVDAALRKAMGAESLRPGTDLVPQRVIPKTIFGGEAEERLYLKPPFWAGRRIS